MHRDEDEVGPRSNGDGTDPGSDPPRRKSTTDSPNAAHVLRAGAILDAPAAAELRRDAKALFARSAHPLVVDLTAIHTAEHVVASAVLRELAYEAGDADVDFRVVCGPAATELARALLDDETLFEVYPSLDAALDPAAEAPSPGDHQGQPRGCGKT